MPLNEQKQNLSVSKFKWRNHMKPREVSMPQLATCSKKDTYTVKVKEKGETLAYVLITGKYNLTCGLLFSAI